MKKANSAGRTALKNKILALIISMLILVSIFTYDIATIKAEDEKQPPTQTEEPQPEVPQDILGEFQGTGEKPVDLPGQYGPNDVLSESQKKLSTRLLQLLNEDFLPPATTQSQIISQMEKLGQLAISPVINGADSESSGLEIYVYINFEKGADTSIFKQHVKRIVDKDEDYGLAAAWVDVNSLDALASLNEVKSIREIIPPVLYTGSALSEGDALHNADDVRAITGADGSGVKIGIISDGVDSYASAVVSGDLPASLTVLGNSIGGDEGTAMLEIVHDLAPGAQLYFHDCGNTVFDFTNAIDDLAAAGCTIICDDIGWIAEPFFEDGYVAQHVEDLTTAQDILYVTSAGNAAYKHYQGTFYNNGSDYTDFSRGTDTQNLYAHLYPGSRIRVILQWNEPFGGASSDYQLYLTTADASVELQSSENVQNGNDDPIEWILYTNSTGSEMDVAIRVFAENAPVDKELEIYIYDASVYTNNIVTEDSIFGQAAATGAVSVGAINVGDPDNIAYYSSRGPVTTLTGTRQKPDICGAAGVSVTGAGGFSNPFYGTSAAAPHIAAIAGLLESRFTNMSADEIKQLMFDTADDLGSAGYDSVFGYGRADAYTAATSYFVATFDSQGGSAVEIQVLSNGDKITKPADPTLADADFIGWYKEAACINPWDFDVDTISADTTLYAKFVSFDGEGTESLPYIISTKTDLNDVRYFPTAHFSMANDIVFTESDFTESGDFYNSGEGFIPIGTVDTPFSGVFDGNGYAIEGLYQNISSASGVLAGLFGYIDSATVQNTGLEGSSISADCSAGYSYVGGIVGHAVGSSTIINCYNTGDISSNGSPYCNVGGIAGKADSNTIENCFNMGSVNGSSSYYCVAGGITGWGSVSNCYNTGEIFSSAVQYSYAGGISGMSSSVSHCYDIGGVGSETTNPLYDPYYGGIVGGINDGGSTTDNYYIDSIPMGVGYGTDNAVSVDRTQLSQQSTFTGFDFTSTWTMDGNTTYAFPELQAATMPGKYVTSIEVTSTSDIIDISTTLQMNAQVLPSDADDKSYIWSIENDTGEATIDESGLLTGVALGTVTVKATSNDVNMIVGSKEIEVVRPATGVSLNTSSIELSVGQNYTLTATVEPPDASNTSVTWTSSNESVATVTDGVVSAVSEGTSKITVKTVDGGFEATCDVNVVVPVTGVSLDEGPIDLFTGDTYQLTETVLPENATNKSVTWSSNNEGAALVSDGLVSAIGDGEATITVTTVDGSFEATCVVKVTTPVTGVSLNKETLVLELEDTDTLIATVEPSDATNKSVTWASSDESVATVSDGVVSAVAEGDATITVTTVDGDFTATCDVSVIIKSDNDYLRSCIIDFGDEHMTFSDSVWGEFVVDKTIIVDSVIDLEMPNYFTQCELKPGVSDTEKATYKIFDGTTLLSSNAPYVVDIPSAGTETLSVEVTAENGDTRSYTVNITRAEAENEAYPFQIVFSSEYGGGDWFEPSFEQNRYTYDKTIENEILSAQVSVYPVDADASYTIYLNGDLLGTDQSAEIDFTAGTNKVEIVLTSQPNVQRTYTFLIHRKNSDSLLDLQSLSANSIVSSNYSDNTGYYDYKIENFNPSLLDYDLDVPNATAEIAFKVYTENDDATVVVKKGSVVISETADIGYQTTLDVGLNEFTFEVSHPALGYTKTYTVDVTRAVSDESNADLCNLLVAGRKIDGFDSDVISYEHYANGSAGLTLHPVAANTGATYQIFKDAALVADNEPTNWETLNSAPMNTVFTVVVTAANGVTQRTYTLIVNTVSSKAELNSLAFSNNSNRYNVFLEDAVYTYSFDAAYADDVLKIETSSNENSEIVIYDESTLIWQDGMGSIWDVELNLDVGLNTFAIEVTAEDGITQKTYTISITRMAAPAIDNVNVCSLLLYVGGDGGAVEFGEEFTSDIIDYSYSVENSYNSSELYFVLESGFATSKVYLNGYMMEECGYEKSSCALNNLRINEGLNILEIVVTAQDGSTTKTYTFNITRESSTLVSLEMISEPGKLEYLDGEALDLTGLSILANFSSGDMKMLDGNDVTASGFDNTVPGAQTVTLTYQDKSVTYEVTVYVRVSSVELNKETLSLIDTNSETLTANVLPANASSQEVFWESDNTDVATVNQSGLVTAVGVGTANITATADGVSGTCAVTVSKKAVVSVLLSSSSEELMEGDTVTLTAEVLPADATYPQITWSSSNTGVATVDQNGKVKAVAKGTATIYGTADGVDGTCLITVTELEQLESSVYTVDRSAGLLKDISIKTSVTELKSNLSNNPDDIKVYDKNGTQYNGELVASGMVVKLVIDGTVKDSLTISILADISGDGKIDIDDILYIRADILNTYNFSSYEKEAADVNKDGEIDIDDILYIRAHILGTYNIHSK